MKILKYKKSKANEYQITMDEGQYNLYDDLIIKHELLLKKDINKKEWEEILKENNLLKAYYEGLKVLNNRLRTEKELNIILKKKGYSSSEINYALKRLEKESYLDHQKYIESFIHDALALNIVGENKIVKDLEKLGFNEAEIKKELKKVDPNIYLTKIKKYIAKKLKANKKSANEFKQKIMLDLINKGFNKEDIARYLSTLIIEDNPKEIEKIINKLYSKYIAKYDLQTTKMKIKQYLYLKGYTNIDIDTYIKRTPK